jgi:hypothetical protein
MKTRNNQSVVPERVTKDDLPGRALAGLSRIQIGAISLEQAIVSDLHQLSVMEMRSTASMVSVLVSEAIDARMGRKSRPYGRV